MVIMVIMVVISIKVEYGVKVAVVVLMFVVVVSMVTESMVIVAMVIVSILVHYESQSMKRNKIFFENSTQVLIKA